MRAFARPALSFLLSLAALFLGAQAPGYQHIVINEIAPITQGDHAIELYNYGPDQLLTNWSISVKTDVNGSPLTFNIPVGLNFTLKRHALVTLHWSTGSSTATDIFMGPWSGGFSTNGEAILRDNSGRAIDYVRWGAVTPVLLTTDISWPAGASVTWGNTTCSLYRVRDTQTRTASDWIVDCLGGPTTFNQLAKNQIGTRRYSPVMINEIDRVSAPQRVELFNPNNFSVNLAAWRLIGYQGAGSTVCATVVFGSPTNLAAGGYLNVPLNGSTCNWSGTNQGEVALLDPSVSTQKWDAVAFNSAGQPQFAGNNYLIRKTDIQSGSALDWAANPTGSPGGLNPGQIGGSHSYGELGGIESPNRTAGTGGPGGIGNRIRITRATTLREIKFRANVLAGGVTMQAGVYQLTNPSPEQWSLIQTVTLPASVLNEQVYSTGALTPGIRLSSPGEYAVMVFANGNMNIQETLVAEFLEPGLASGVIVRAGYPAPAGSGLTFGATDTTVAAALQLLMDVQPAISPETSTVDKEAGSSISPVFTSPGAGLAWSMTSGTPPASVTFQAATATLVGTPADGDVGSYPNIKIRATDPANGNIYDENTYTLQIHPRLQWVTASLAAGEQGVTYYPPGVSLAASGGPPGGYQWALQSGTLPPGLSLNTSLGRIEGTPSTPGSFGPFTLRVTDALGVTADRPFTVTIFAPLVINTVTLPSVNQGAPYNQTLSVTGGDAASRSWSIIAGALPPGMNLSAAGQITGASATPGTHNFTVRVADATGGQATRPLSITVNGPLSIVTPSLPDGEDGFPYSVTIMASGGDGSYTWSANSGLPVFCTFSGAGLLDCPSPLPLSVALSVRVTDGTSAFVDKLFNFNFADQPVINSPPTSMAVAEVGVAYAQGFGNSGGVPPFTWSTAGLPAGLSMSAAGTVSGTPSTSGTFGITAIVDDSLGGHAERNYDLQILPHVEITTLSLPPGELTVPYSGSLTGNLGQAPYAFSLFAGALPPGVSLSAAGALSGTPTSTGMYTPTFRITDALGGVMDLGLPIFIAPELSVPPPNPPVAEQGISYMHVFQVSAGTGVPPFDFALTPSVPPGMSFSNVSGELSGTPSAAGNHNLNLQVTDALGVVKSQSFTLTIAPPVAITTPLTLPMAEQGVPYNLSFTAVDGVPPYTWVLTMGVMPAGLTFNPNGSISGTPTGTGESFNLRVTDAVGGIADKGFLLNVAPPVQVTTMGPLPFGEATVPYNAGGGFQLNAADGILPYAWSISAGSLPPGVSLSSSGLISGTPAASGLFGFTSRVQDAAGGVATRAFILTINPAPAIINTSLPRGVLQVNYPAINLIVEDGQPPYAFSIVTGTLPAGVTFNTTTGQFGGKPTQKESQTLQFRVTDALGATHTRSLTIQVIDPPLPEDWSRRANFSGGVGQIVLPKNYNGVTLPVAYAAADGGGELFRSVDRGLSWQPFLVDPNNAGAPIHTLKLTPDFNYAGAVFSGEIYVSAGAGGVYRSEDGGATFSPQNTGLPGANTLEGPRSFAIAVHPNYPTNRTVWVVTIVNVLGTDYTRLYRSDRTNDGDPENWSLVSSISTIGASGVAQLEPSPNFSSDNTMFAVYDGKLYRSSDAGANFTQIINPSGMNERIRRVMVAPTPAGPLGVFAESNLQALYRSLDGGNSFIIEGIPGHDLAVCGTGVSRSLYVKLPPGGGEYALAKSQDFGKTWIPVYARGMRPNGEVFGSSLAAGGPGACDLFSGTQAGMTVSTDDGNIFFPRQTGIATIKANSISGRGSFVVAGTDGGFLRSKDGGLTFIQSQNIVKDDNSVIKLPNITLVAVSPSYDSDKVFFVSLISNFGSQVSSLFRTTDGGYTFKQVLYMNVNSIAFRPGFNGDTGPVMTMYAGTNTGVFVSTDGGLTFNVMNGMTSLQCNSSTRKETDGFTLSPRGILPPRLYRSGDNGICYSDDEGATWSMMLGGGGAPFRGTISSPPTNVQSGTGLDRLLMRTDFITYQIYTSTDNGATWNCVLQPSGPSCMNGIVYARAFFSPNYAIDRTALIAVNRSFGSPGGLYRYDGNSNRAFPLTSYGGSDQLRGRVITGIYMTPSFNGDNTTNSVALVTTEGGGLYRSVDGGRSFQPVSRYDYASSNVRNMMRAEGGAVGFTGESKARLKIIGPQQPSSTAAGTLVTASDDGVFASDDGGITFDDISNGLPEANVMATWVPSAATSTALAGIEDQGLWVYNGTTWSQDATYNSGTFVNFTEDDDYLYAVREDGTSLRGTKSGTGWSALTDAGGDLQMVSSADAAAFSGSGGADKLAGPRMPSGTTASLWSVSLASGPKYSSNSGSTWTTSSGGNDYTLPSGASGSYKVVAAMGLNTVTGAREAVVGYNGGVYRTTDGGDTWKNVSGTGSGLEATTKNATAILTSTTAQGGMDVLVGISGTSSTGGVYLSGDGGEHWTQINSGFDASTLSISTLVKTSCTGCPVQYYTGSYGGGMYTRTVTINAPPLYTTPATMCVGSSCTCTSDTAQWTGSINGGEAFKICGSNFATGAVVEFDGVAATGCAPSGGTSPNFTTITCTGTPAHAAGAARVRIRNTDTRVGYLATSFTYAGADPISRAGESMKVTKSGDDITISYTCAACNSTYPARVHRAQNSALTSYPEIFNGGASGTQTSCTAQGGHTSCYGQSGLAASSNTRSYFWKVE